MKFPAGKASGPDGITNKVLGAVVAHNPVPLLAAVEENKVGASLQRFPQASHQPGIIQANFHVGRRRQVVGEAHL